MKSKQKTKTRPVICPYCGAQAILREGSYLFEDAGQKHLYVCTRYPSCDSYVTAHERTLEPMGMLADQALRRKRMEAHSLFDQLWKKGIFSRRDSYKWMCDRLLIDRAEAHIANFNGERCERLIRDVKAVLRNRRMVQGGI